MIPEAIGRYEVQCLLGEGAFGQVFAAHDPALGRGVAIKLLRSMYSGDSNFMARFRSEAASLAALSHANITALYDILEGEEHGMVMELVHGHTLDHVLQQMHRMPVNDCLAVIAQVTAGLSYIHRRGIVHRDIKPSNIMLKLDGVLKIMDFGIARIQGSTRLTHDGSAVGTLAYAAPEQIKRDEATPASDQYSMACMIYEMLSGEPPFDAPTEFELMQAQISSSPKPVSAKVPGLALEIDQALLKALSKSPQERFETIEHFATALGAQDLQGDAVSIVRALMSRADVLPPIPERSSASTGRTSRPKPVKPVRAPSAGGLRANTPFLAVGAAVGIAVAVGTVILLDQRAGQHPIVVMAEQTQALSGVSMTPPSSTRTDSPLAIAPPQASKAQPAGISPPRAVPLPSPPSATSSPPGLPSPPAQMPSVPQGPQNKRSIDEAVQKPTLDVAPNTGDEPTVNKLDSFIATSGRPTPPQARQPVHAMPKGSPTYQGRVENWMGGNLLYVQSPTGGVTKMDLSLYGIVGNEGSLKEAMEVRARLEAFAKGRVIKCWLLQEDNKPKNQCFLDGTDIALWALQQKLVRPSKHAPPEYVAVKQ